MPVTLPDRLLHMLRAMRAWRPRSVKRRTPVDDDRPQHPPEEPALVPVGPPKRPRPSSAVALPLPEPEIREVDAYGRQVDDGDDFVSEAAG